MGCVSEKPSKDPLGKNYLEDQRQQSNSAHPVAAAVAETAAKNEKDRESHHEEEALRDSGKPAWNNQQFLSLPEVEGKHLQNSPIQIIYSSDHQQFPDKSIRKDLFNAKLENEVIHEVSQDELDSRMIAGSIKEEISSINHKLKQNSAKLQSNQVMDVSLHQVMEVTAIGEEQTMQPFQLYLPRIQVYPSFAVHS